MVWKTSSNFFTYCACTQKSRYVAPYLSDKSHIGITQALLLRQGPPIRWEPEHYMRAFMFICLCKASSLSFLQGCAGQSRESKRMRLPFGLYLRFLLTYII